MTVEGSAWPNNARLAVSFSLMFEAGGQPISGAGGGRSKPCKTDSRRTLPIAPNRLQQVFVAAAPNRVWLADITHIATGEGWLCLAAVLDLATRKIAGWPMRDHRRTALPLAALMMGRSGSCRPKASSAIPIEAADTPRRSTPRNSLP